MQLSWSGSWRCQGPLPNFEDVAYRVTVSAENTCSTTPGEHSLWARVREAQLVNSLPSTMRMTQVYERLRSQRSVLTTINGALDAAGQEVLDPKPLENRLTWVSRAIAVASAAQLPTTPFGRT
jgi:hypothetical protein